MHSDNTRRPNASADWRDWFNPRRRLHAEAIVNYLRFYGRRVWIGDDRGDGYHHIWQDTGLRRYQVDLALDDLYTLGAIDIRASRISLTVVELLIDDLDDILCSGPAAVEPVAPQQRGPHRPSRPRREARDPRDRGCA